MSLGTTHPSNSQALSTPTKDCPAGVAAKSALPRYSAVFFATSKTGFRRLKRALVAAFTFAIASLPLRLTQFHAWSRPIFLAKSTTLPPTHFAAAQALPPNHLIPSQTLLAAPLTAVHAVPAQPLSVFQALPAKDLAAFQALVARLFAALQALLASVFAVSMALLPR